MERLYIDIETLPATDPNVMWHIKENMKPPGQIKKPESIQNWLADPENLTNALKKTSLSGLFGTICCLGIATDTGNVTILQGDERAILEDFLAICRTTRGDGEHMQKTLIGHNILGFDAPFISQRMIIHGMGPLFPFSAAKWDMKVEDTMAMFAGSSRDYIKLVDLCVALGIKKPLDEIDGSQVADAWRDGEAEKIFAHCDSDVMATRDCHHRMIGYKAAEQEKAA